jgi:hypothetical protein
MWARAEGVPDEVKNYKGIYEVGFLIGAVDDVDMQILSDLDVVRFQVDVRGIKKFPMVKQFAVKPWMYNITFSIERVIEEGTLEEVEPVPREVAKSKDTEQIVYEEEQARATTKLKASADEMNVGRKNGEGVATERTTDADMMVKNGSQMQNNGEKLIEENVNPNMVADDNTQNVEAEKEKEEEEREEELVDFEDSQDKLAEQEDEEIFES